MDEMACINAYEGDCKGPVQYRMPVSASGRSFPRCEWHWERRLIQQDQLNARYPWHRPADFDPTFAGEQWEEDE